MFSLLNNNSYDEVISYDYGTLKKAASAIADYQWGHMGSCNCSLLAQQITRLRKDEIHHRAMKGHGDWDELNDYCLTGGLPMDDLISSMLSTGFNIDDLKHLERLSDPAILQILPFHERNLKHNVKADVVNYINAWISLLEYERLNLFW